MVSCWWNELPDDLVISSTFPSSAYDYFLTDDIWNLLNFNECSYGCIVYVCLSVMVAYVCVFVYIVNMFNVCVCMCVFVCSCMEEWHC